MKTRAIILITQLLLCPALVWAEAPSNEALYKMIQALEARLNETTQEASIAKAEATKAKAEAAKAKEELAQIKQKQMESEIQSTATIASTATTPTEPATAKLKNESGWIVDVRGIYLVGGRSGADPATGVIDNVGSISSTMPGMDGGGLRVSLYKQNNNGWFVGGGYEGHFVDGDTSRGQRGVDLDNIHANLVNRSLADNNALNGNFDDGRVDYATDDFDIDKHTADLIFGKNIPISSRSMAYWKLGLRAAYSDADRDVFYENTEAAADTDFARINFNSQMWGLGPLVGAGATFEFGQGFAISGGTSISGVYSKYDLTRNESNFNQSLARTATANFDVDTYGMVPIIDGSIDITKTWNNNFYVGLGYMASSWLGGSRSLSIPGWDDIDASTSPYTIEKDDIFVHGVYLRTGMNY